MNFYAMRKYGQVLDNVLALMQNRRVMISSIATRQALNRLRTQSRRREDYVGPWLPEPLVTAPDIADDVVLARTRYSWR